MMGAFDTLARLGVRVFETIGLDVDVVYEHASRGQPGRGFIRADLSAEDRLLAAEWLLSAALDDLLPGHP